MALEYGDLNAWEESYRTSSYNSAYNGLTGVKEWECYMLIKYGRPGSFGLSGDEEFLIELPIYPDEVTEQISARWATQDILGRSAPISAYAGTSLKTVQFSLELHRDLLTGSFSHTAETLKNAGGSLENQSAGRQKQSIQGPFGTRTWYINANKMLQMACYPQYTANGLIPPTTYFVFGQMILNGFVHTYSTDWKKPILNTFYGWNTVNISMECYPDTIISAESILNGAGAASTQNTYNTLFPDKSAENSNVMKTYNGGRGNNRNVNSLGGQVIDTA